MHEGIPPGGVLVPELAARANRAVGNADGAALIEVFGGLTLEARDGSTLISCDDGVARALATNERVTVLPSRTLRVRYVAFAGGLAVPEVLGGQGTLLVANLGGHQGRALRAGDCLPVASPDRAEPALERLGAPGPPLDLSRAVRVFVGPDSQRFAADALTTLASHAFTVLSASDRTGVRLGGATLPRSGDDTGHSSPMVRGAIQVPASGLPIVLGPDHPTTGGYPVVAVVARADLGLLLARPLGATVRFTVLERP